MTFFKWVLALIIGVITIGCSPEQQAIKLTSEVSETNTSQSEAVYKTLSIDEFVEIVDNTPDEYSIVNVHIPYAGEIPNTDDNIPFNEIDALTSAFPDKDSPIIVYCRSGNMSETATRDLVGLGYTNVYDIPGGMNAWQSNGRDLEFAG